MQHALILINPHSRNGSEDALSEAIDSLKSGGFEVSVRETESEDHLVTLIENYQYDDGVIVLAGGDGTISTGLEAIHKYQRTMAIFPLGTANDLARSLGVPEDLVAAAQLIIDGKRERISLGKVNNHFFVNVAHIGLGVDVTRELSSESKKWFGVLAYLGAFFKAIKRNKSFKVHITSDDWQCSTRAIHLAVGNGRYYGGGNIVDQRSTIVNGELHLFFIKPRPWWRLLLLGPNLRDGTLADERHIVRQSAQRFSIVTSKPKELEADGEFKTKTPVEFEIIPEAIDAIVGDIPTHSGDV